MKDRLSRAEIRKDALQGSVEAAATAVGQVTSILTGAVREVAGAVGGFATEIFEIRDSTRRALVDQDEVPADTPGPREPAGPRQEGVADEVLD